MSQKKVDAYKAQKANREKIMKKEKAILRLEKLAAAVVCVAAVCWLGYSVYDKIISVQDTVVTETVMDVTALDDYLTDLSLQMEDTEEEISEEDGADASEDADVSDEDSADASEDADVSDEDSADAAEDTNASDENSADAAEDTDASGEDGADASEGTDASGEDGADAAEDTDASNEDGADS